MDSAASLQSEHSHCDSNSAPIELELFLTRVLNQFISTTVHTTTRLVSCPGADKRLSCPASLAYPSWSTGTLPRNPSKSLSARRILYHDSESRAGRMAKHPNYILLTSSRKSGSSLFGACCSREHTCLQRICRPLVGLRRRLCIERSILQYSIYDLGGHPHLST